MNTDPKHLNDPEIDRAEIDREIEELLSCKKDSKPRMGAVVDSGLPNSDNRIVTKDKPRPASHDDIGLVYFPTKKKSVLKPFLIGLILVILLGFGAVKGFQALHIGKTECCDGTWSDSKGSGTCSHHGGIIGVGCRQCQDGTWSTAKGGGACSRHGGLKK